ncbi:MAG: hypothetical protein R6X33_11520 [Candidatus Brocadiia bacterium]
MSAERNGGTQENGEFGPVVTYLGGPFGKQKLDVAAEVVVTHDHLDDTARGGELGLMVDRHVNPHTELPCGVFVSRDTPGEDVRRHGPYLSLAVQPPDPDGEPVGGEMYDPDAQDPPHAREWDFLMEHAEKALAEAGVGADASAADKVRAFGRYGVKFKTSPTYASFHPVDVLHHSTYCTGAANVQAALANVHGIPARHCCISNHTMTEVHVDGRWQFIDNHANSEPFVPGSDYVDVTINYDRYDQFTERQKSYISHRRCWARSPWHYSGMLNWHWAWGMGKNRGIRTDVMDGYGVGVPCDPHHAAALYPERGSYPFPAWDGNPVMTLTEKASWLRVNLLFGAGERLQKVFYVGPSDDNPVTAAHVDWWFRGEVGTADVVLDFAGEAIEPSELVPGSGTVTKVRFNLPPDALAESGLHALVLTNRSDRRLDAVVYPTPLVEAPAIATEGARRIRPHSLTSEPILI